MDVYLFGAGASAAEGAPATSDFLAQTWRLLGPDFDERIQAVWHFLEQTFDTSLTGPDSFACLPAVDELISLVDWSLHVNQGLGHDYPPPKLYDVRRNLEHLLCTTLNAVVRRQGPKEGGPHGRFVQRLITRRKAEGFALLSLNYDTMLDCALLNAGLEPDYGFDLAAPPSGDRPILAKLHGSLNWGRCPACDNVEVVLRGSVEDAVCGRCGNSQLQGLIISPTWLKRYDGSHLQRVWDVALSCIQRAERIVFVGYSLPPADVAIYHLLVRGILTRRCQRPLVVEVINHRREGASPAEQRVQEAAVVSRFTRLFGRGVRFDFSGFHGQI